MLFIPFHFITYISTPTHPKRPTICNLWSTFLVFLPSQCYNKISYPHVNPDLSVSGHTFIYYSPSLMVPDALSHPLYSSLYSSIGSSPCAAAGTLPSFNSFSNLIISCKLFAFLINSSTLFRSFSVSLTRYDLEVEDVDAPLVVLVVSKVRDLMPMI